MMAGIDIGDLLFSAILELFTIFLVTIPSVFVSTALDGGILFDVFFQLFGNNSFFQVLFILALTAGPWMWIRSLNRGNTSRNQDMSRKQ